MILLLLLAAFTAACAAAELVNHAVHRLVPSGTFESFRPAGTTAAGTRPIPPGTGSRTEEPQS